MNRVLQILILSACLLTGAFVPAAEAHHWMNLAESGLSGPVQSVTETQLLPEGNTWASIPLRSVVYNADGYATRVKVYRGAHAFEEKGYTYDSQGHVTSSGLYTKEGAFVQQEVHRYNAEGRLAESRYLSPNSLPFLTKRYFYEQGRLAKEQHLAQDGSVIAAKEYEYNDVGHLSSIITLGQDNKVLAKEAIRSDGKETDCQYSGELANYGRRVKIKSEAEGQLGEICYLPDGSVYQNQVCDTKEGDGIKRVVYRADRSIASETIYNSAGDIISERRYASDGAIQLEAKISYQYDAQGNWTQRVLTKYDHVKAEWADTEKTLREITYFD